MIEQAVRLMEQEVSAFLEKQTASRTLFESMEYSFSSGGKRLRPRLLFALLQGYDKELDRDARLTAGAIEMLHTATLIHDDLPEMDNDELRRGKPTNHIAYSPAVALLAGDGLMLAAIQILGKTALSAEVKAELMTLLSIFGGIGGVAAGQTLDKLAEGHEITFEALKEIHEYKTGALFRFVFAAGGLLANRPAQRKLLNETALHLGLAFQIRDDLLDVIGSEAVLGKAVGKDEKLAKATYPHYFGVEKSITMLHEELEKVMQSLRCLEADGFDSTQLQRIIQQLELVQKE
ncbi:MAG: polyprenyl synthetase family protein [Enterococcaceae bacterium]|jgi:geranylgeranyl diphosphate synthase type II|nr:polyprenyl synthetase family protein [Enterococcaceae bacterium]MCI1919125.1 polyprenyl synthetase family protein [Enterococcaceae bacterium]